jgi:hypothetical protein
MVRDQHGKLQRGVTVTSTVGIPRAWLYKACKAISDER